jgi:hypothetical protein
MVRRQCYTKWVCVLVDGKGDSYGWIIKHDKTSIACTLV